jgi:hypothetical protein
MSKRKRSAVASDYKVALSYHYEDVMHLRPQRKEKKPQGFYDERNLFAPVDRALYKQQRVDKWRFFADGADNCYEYLCTFFEECTTKSTHLFIDSEWSVSPVAIFLNW